MSDGFRAQSNAEMWWTEPIALRSTGCSDCPPLTPNGGLWLMCRQEAHRGKNLEPKGYEYWSGHPLQAKDQGFQLDEGPQGLTDPVDDAYRSGVRVPHRLVRLLKRAVVSICCNRLSRAPSAALTPITDWGREGRPLGRLRALGPGRSPHPRERPAGDSGPHRHWPQRIDTREPPSTT